ncbi:hypothetical protein CNY89_25125, partial [Amaricoccus sp. HAR-UPW-R2A-40]
TEKISASSREDALPGLYNGEIRRFCCGFVADFTNGARDSQDVPRGKGSFFQVRFTLGERRIFDRSRWSVVADHPRLGATKGAIICSRRSKRSNISRRAVGSSGLLFVIHEDPRLEDAGL